MDYPAIPCTYYFATSNALSHTYGVYPESYPSFVLSCFTLSYRTKW